MFPWYLHQCITKTQLCRKPGGHPAKFMWPLGRLPTKMVQKIVTGPNPQNKRGGHIWVFKSSRLWIKGLFVSNHLWQTWIKKNPSLQSPPDLRFSYKLRTFSRNPGKVRSEGIVSPGDPDILGPRKLMNKTYLIWNICRHQVDESCSG